MLRFFDAIKQAVKKIGIGTLNQFVLIGIFTLFAVLDKNPSNERAEKALHGLFMAFIVLQSYCATGKLKTSIEQAKFLDAFKATAGVATIPAAVEALSGGKAIKAIVGATHPEFAAYTFTAAFAVDGVIDLGIGLYETLKTHYAVGARFITFSALEAVEAYFGVWQGIIAKNPTGAALGAAAELVKCGLSLAGQAPERPLSVEEIDKQIAAAQARLSGLEAKRAEVVALEGDKASLLRSGVTNISMA